MTELFYVWHACDEFYTLPPVTVQIVAGLVGNCPPKSSRLTVEARPINQGRLSCYRTVTVSEPLSFHIYHVSPSCLHFFHAVQIHLTCFFVVNLSDPVFFTSRVSVIFIALAAAVIANWSHSNFLWNLLTVHYAGGVGLFIRDDIVFKTVEPQCATPPHVARVYLCPFHKRWELTVLLVL